MLTRPIEPLIQTDAYTESFEELRKELLKLQKTYYFDPELDTKVETDSSDRVIAGVCSQLHSTEQYPIGFFSHVLVGVETNQEIHDKELFAIIQAFNYQRLKLILVQSRIKVFSDHRSLEYFMTTKVLTSK